ncbi:hypothetical protein [Bacillus sp. EAC]|uniref:hypothetical protein n=1 Tax=Bacillus sp. EAC TaxID=1978338 RepID=UPI000B45090C|nr:hypothetical protein [Bacillus sp. EAC]
MNWLREMNVITVVNGTLGNGISNEKLEINRIQIDGKCNDITIIAQFFIAIHTLFDLPIVTAFPITNEEVEEIVMEQIAIHFNKIQKIIINNRLERIQLMEIKDFSKNKFLEMSRFNQIHPIIRELYFSSEIIPLEHNFLTFRENKKRYQVLNEKIGIPSQADSSFLDVIMFIKKSFGVSKEDNHTSVISPAGWKIKNDIKKLESIKLFSQYFNLELIVDSDNGQILAIDLLNR